MGTKEFDFTEFIIADTDGEISAIPSKMSWVEFHPRLLEEKTGSIAFSLSEDADLEVNFGVSYSNINLNTGVGENYNMSQFFISDALKDIRDFLEYNGLRFDFSHNLATSKRLRLRVSEQKESPGSTSSDDYITGVDSFVGYPKINYTAGAGTSGKGQYIATIYSDEEQTNLLSTLTIDGEFLTLFEMSNYVIAPASQHQDPGHEDFTSFGDGYTENLIFTGDGVGGGDPEIDITGNGISISNGDVNPSVNDDTDWGGQVKKTSVNHTFTIDNSGGGDLDLTDSPRVSMSGDTAQFTLVTDASTPVAGSGSTTFIIAFNPKKAIPYSAIVSIANNDDSENPYTFKIVGIGTKAKPPKPKNWEDGLDDIARTPQFKVIPTFDVCSLIFSNSPCTATGVECYNTRSTCKDPQNYALSTRDLSFTMSNSPAPFLQGERPYVRSIDFLPTEIKTDLTVKGRVNIVMEDEPDSDATEDPYFTTRATVNKTGYYWRRLIARNPFYVGRPIKIFEGFLGLTSDQFELRWEGRIDNISFNNDGSVNISAVDILQDLAKIEVPEKLDLSLLVNMTAASTESLTLNTVTALTSTGFVRIDDEIIAYASKDDLTGILSGLTRGSFNTIPAEHEEDTKAQNTRHYGPANPFDIMSSAMLLIDGGIPATSINATAFVTERDLIPIEPSFEGLIVEPTRLDRLYFEIAGHVGARSWQDENQQITIKRDLPNQPGRVYSTVSEEANIIEETQSLNLNADSRISRTSMYWEYNHIDDFDDPVAYNRINIVIDVDAESTQEYDQVSEERIFSRWIRLGNDASSAVERYANNVPARLLSRNRDPRELLSMTLELKDSTIATGENVKVTTQKIVDIFGNGLEKERFMVVKRDKIENDLDIITQRHRQKPMGWISAATASTDYGTASDAQKEYGFIASSTSQLLDNTDPAYRIF